MSALVFVRERRRFGTDASQPCELAGLRQTSWTRLQRLTMLSTRTRFRTTSSYITPGSTVHPAGWREAIGLRHITRSARRTTPLALRV